ncbi:MULTISPECIES: DUF4148 domain-containing protein [unclassified Paraburkholderia]|uniref:DUF4148 domain-containing protein n=1 Tax=unclassified Paraburkholderia TaxID=2615204 RepID=UPI0020B6B321|nr:MULTISPECIES: DUF4148 domain-containing protein [unclassified Paraburkholderia]MCP3717732.1 DUF4148 domain-containing protein [Paraburkholderia sp. CNPSo 3281]MCP3725868.1 DUF4148 domain-containing protein [Paraburkholderia sp. CNPSo 3272]
MRSTTSKLTLAAATAAFLIGVAAPAFAQTEASAPAAAAASQPLTKEQKAQAKAQAKAQRKAERKQARAKNNAELKKLEDAGYKPALNDPNYPQNLQDAQKKANAAAGASQ